MEYPKDHTERYSAFQLAGAANICSSLRYLVNAIGGIDPVAGEPDMNPRGEFSDRLTALYDIHVLAARFGLINANLDAVPHGMFRAKGDVANMTKDEVFLGGVEGRFTHPLSKWIELDKEGRLTPEDREVIRLQYAGCLSSNLHAVGNAFYCSWRAAREEMKKTNRQPTLLRLFTRRQFPICQMLPGFDEKNMSVLDWKKMFTMSYAGGVPELRIPKTVLQGVDFDQSDMQSVKLVPEEGKKQAVGQEQAFSRNEHLAWFEGLSFDDLVLAFKYYGPDGDTPDTKAPGYIVDPHDRGIINKALSDYLNIPTDVPEVDETIIRDSSRKMFLNAVSFLSDNTLKQMKAELSDADLGKAVSTGVENAPAEKIYRSVPALDTYLKTNANELGTASKFQRIQVRAGVPGEEITTIASDGTKETRNTVHEGDFVVHNVGNPDNQWIIDAKTMMKKYEPVPGEEGIYKPKGGPMKVYALSEPIEFTAPWGEKMRVEADGYILQDPDNPKDAYGISRKDFEATYKINEAEAVSLSKEELSPDAVKERLREDIDYECSRVLRTLDEHGKMKAPVFSPAQDMEGNIFCGFNGVRLNAELAAYGAQTSVFVTEQDIRNLHVQLLPAEKARFCTLEDGSRVWNLTQTTYKRDFASHFRAIEIACRQPAQDDEVRKGMVRFWKVDMAQDGNPEPSEGERQKAVKTFLRENFPTEQSGTVEEATKKSTIAYAVASLSMISKMRYDPKGTDDKQWEMQFADIDDVRSYRKGSSMYPAYETMRSAGEIAASAETKHPVFQQRQGIDVNAVIRDVNASIRIRNERLREVSESKDNGIHR